MVQFYDPKQEQEVKRRRRMAELMMQASKQPDRTEMVGGFAVPQSPLAGLAKAFGTAYSGYEAGQADKAEAEINQRKADLLRQVGGKITAGDTAGAASDLFQNPEFAKEGLDLAKEDAQSRRALEIAKIRSKGGSSYVDPVTGELVQAPERKLSSTEQKEIFDSMDLQNAGNAAGSALSRAQKILMQSPEGEQPYSGFGADVRTAVARLPLIGDIVADKERGAATTEYKNLVQEQALNNLKAIFGGNPTEGERQILLQLQALPTYTPQEQERILKNAQLAAENRTANNANKIHAIQTGDYRVPQSPAMPPATASSPDNVALPQGAQLVGTSGGKRVYRLPNGQHVMEQ